MPPQGGGADGNRYDNMPNGGGSANYFDPTAPSSSGGTDNSYFDPTTASSSSGAHGASSAYFDPSSGPNAANSGYFDPTNPSTAGGNAANNAYFDPSYGANGGGDGQNGGDEAARGQRNKNKDANNGERQNRQPILKFFFFLFMAVGWALQCYVFISPQWVVSQKEYPPDRQRGLIRECTAGSCRWVPFEDIHHWAWRTTTVLMGMALVFLGFTTIFALIIFFHMKDKLFKYALILEFWAGLFLLVANLIFPVGFESAKTLPCHFAVTEEKSYHLCNPWTPGLAIWLDIAAMVAFTIAGCLGSCINDKEQKSNNDENSEENKDSGPGESLWYEENNAKDEPDVAETAFNHYANDASVAGATGTYMDVAENGGATGAATGASDAYLDVETSTGQAAAAATATDAYMDVQEPDGGTETKSGKAASSTGGSNTVQATSDESYLELETVGDAGAGGSDSTSTHKQQETSFAGADTADASYIDVNNDESAEPSRAGGPSAIGNPEYLEGQQGDGAYMDLETEQTPAGGASALSNPGYGVGQGADADGSYMDLETEGGQGDTAGGNGASALSNPGYGVGHAADGDVDAAYMDVELQETAADASSTRGGVEETQFSGPGSLANPGYMAGDQATSDPQYMQATRGDQTTDGYMELQIDEGAGPDRGSSVGPAGLSNPAYMTGETSFGNNGRADYMTSLAEQGKNDTYFQARPTDDVTAAESYMFLEGDKADDSYFDVEQTDGGEGAADDSYFDLDDPDTLTDEAYMGLED